MKKLFFLLILVLSFLFSNSQTIEVINKASLLPINEVFIYSLSKNFSSTTNNLGQVDLSIVKNTDTLIFEHVGYNFFSLERSLINNVVYLTPKNYRLNSVVLKGLKNKPFFTTSIHLTKKELGGFQGGETSALLEKKLAVSMQKSQSGSGSPNLRGMEANRLLLVVDDFVLNNAISRSGHTQELSLVNPFLISDVKLMFGPSSIIYGDGAMGGGIIFNTLSPSFSDSIKNYFIQEYQSSSSSTTAHYHSLYKFKGLACLSAFSISSFNNLTMGSLRLHNYENWGRERHMTSGKEQLKTNYHKAMLTHKILSKSGENSTFLFHTEYGESSKIHRFDKLNDLSINEPKYLYWYYGPKKRFFQKIKFKTIMSNVMFDEGSICLTYQKIDESRHTQKFSSSFLSNRYEKIDTYDLRSNFKKNIFNGILKYGVSGRFQKVSSNANLQTKHLFLYNTTRYPDGGSNMIDYSLYSYLKFPLKKYLGISFGARLNYSILHASFVDNLTYNLPFNEIKINNSLVSYSSRVFYYFDKDWELNFSIYDGFRNPNIDDVGKMFSKNDTHVIIPNSKLTPEKSLTFEVGIKKISNSNLKLDLYYFQNHLKNAIVRRDAQLNGLDSLFYEEELMKIQMNQNLHSAIISGINFYIQFLISPSIKFTGSCNYTEDVFSSDRLPLAHISPMNISGFLDYTYKNFIFSFYSHYNSKKDASEFDLGGVDNLEEATINGLPSWYTLNMKIQSVVSSELRIIFGIENILDSHYKTFGSGISASGRNLILSLHSSF